MVVQRLQEGNVIMAGILRPVCSKTNSNDMHVVNGTNAV